MQSLTCPKLLLEGNLNCHVQTGGALTKFGVGQVVSENVLDSQGCMNVSNLGIMSVILSEYVGPFNIYVAICHSI